MKGLMTGYTNHIKMIDPDEFFKKNRVICCPSDYVKLAESGCVKLLVDAGVAVVQSDLAEAGKMITTGAIAIAIMQEEKNG